jgi:hypothetical protein
MPDDDLTPEVRTRLIIDAKFVESGWVVQDRDELNLAGE